MRWPSIMARFDQDACMLFRLIDSWPTRGKNIQEGTQNRPSERDTFGPPV